MKRKAEEDPVPILTLYEWPDFEALQEICELELPQQHEAKMIRYLKACKKMVGYRIRMGYFQSPGCARLHAQGKGMQSMKGWMRRAITWRHYHDLDFVNCGPTILLQLLTASGLAYLTKELESLVKHREVFYSRIPIPRAEAKKLCNAILWGAATVEPALKLLQKDMRKAAKAFVKLYPKEFALFVLDRDDHTNERSKFMCKLMFDTERECLKALCEFVVEEKRTVGVLTNDGLLMERTTEYDGPMLDAPDDRYALLAPEWLQRASAYILKKAHIHLQVSEKSLLLSHEELVLIHGPRVLKMMKTDKHRVKYLLTQAGKGKRRQGLFVLKPHPTIPKCFIQDQSAKTFINATLAPHTAINWKMKDMLEWFTSIDSEQFPLLIENHTHIGFLDCVLSLATNTTQAWQDYKGICTHFFDRIYPTVFNTPNWDKIITHQLSAEGYRMLHIMIGRLFYPVGTDNWQVYLFLLGDGNTGKSTVMHIINAMFAGCRVGVISGQQEKTFGFQTLYDKRVILVFDTPTNFHLLVDQTTYQGIISGDMISVSVKCEAPIFTKWSVPLLMSGNAIPAYKDISGSISRRVFWLAFRQRVLADNRDTSLYDQILQDELVMILVRSLNAYHNMRLHATNHDFWSYVAGPEFDDMQKQTAATTNTLDQFLDNGSQRVIPMFAKDAYVLQSSFQDEYNVFLESLKLKREKLTDFGKFKERGFEIRELNVCNKCYKPATKKYCKCEVKGRRVQRKLIWHMQLDEPAYVDEKDASMADMLQASEELAKEELQLKIEQHSQRLAAH